jgi:hypothetical protein
LGLFGSSFGPGKTGSFQGFKDSVSRRRLSMRISFLGFGLDKSDLLLSKQAFEPVFFGEEMNDFDKGLHKVGTSSHVLVRATLE